MNCRLCGGIGRIMFRLADTPIANSFPEKPDEGARTYPLALQQCFDCGHVQLSEHVAVDWVDYRYRTPEAARPQLKKAAEDLRAQYPGARTVLEIGSNNGLYLEELSKVGFIAKGVDPCGTTPNTIKSPFSESLAKMLPKFDIVVANNVLAHVDNLQDVFRGIDAILKDDGVLVFEFQYLPAMARSGSFDMIYHEHRDYHTIGPLAAFLWRHGFVIMKGQELPAHGGSMRLFCERPGVPSWSFLDERIDWKSFAKRVEGAKQTLLDRLPQEKVIMFGATAKACTLIHHFGIADRISFCMDSTPEKQGRYIPGTSIKIIPEASLKRGPVLLMAWNYAEVIRKRYPGVEFIVPFEELIKEAA